MIGGNGSPEYTKNINCKALFGPINAIGRIPAAISGPQAMAKVAGTRRTALLRPRAARDAGSAGVVKSLFFKGLRVIAAGQRGG